MKTINWNKESIFLIILTIPWIAYLILHTQLPDHIPSHYTINDNGNWVADRYMSPLGNVISLFIAALVVYAAMTAPAFFRLTRNNEEYTNNWLYYFKLAIVLFIVLAPVYLMLAAAGYTPELSGTVTANLVMVLLLVILNAFQYLLFSKLKNKGKKPLPEKQYNIIWAATHVLTSLAPISIILASQGMQAERLVPEAVFLFLAIIGNFMYNIRPNRFIGIRTPWTLSNEEVWIKTHRLGAKWTFWTGVTGFILCVFAPVQWLGYLLFFIVTGVSAILITYSYVIHKKIAG